MTRNCVTHFYACDCREEKFKKLEEENKLLKSSVKIVIKALELATNKIRYRKLKEMHVTDELKEALENIKEPRIEDK